MTSFHGCHTTLHYLNPYHSSYEAPMAAYHHPHYQSYEASMATLHNCKTTLHYHPQHHLEFSSTTEDRLEAALAKLTLSQHNLAASIDTLATTIDNLLQRLPCNPTPHFSSSFLAQTPPPPPLFKPTPSPTRTAFTTVPPPSATTPPPPPPPPLPPLVPIQSQPTTWSDPLPRPVLHLSDLVRPTMPFTKLFSRVPPRGTAMAGYTLPAMTVAFCTIAKPGAIPRNKPWDPDIIFLK